MSSESIQPLRNTSHLFYLNEKKALPSEYVYDETYKNYKTKQKFQKDPKYNYFNAVMQMKRKLSVKEQIYKNVFETSDNQQQESSIIHKKFSHFPSDFSQFPTDFKVQKMNNSSYKIMKKQSLDALLAKDKTQDLLNRTGMSHYKNRISLQKGQFSMQMINRNKNNKTYVELEVKDQTKDIRFQPTNPRPRLTQIMAEYRKISRHSNQQKSKKSSLPREFVERLYMTNKMYSLNANQQQKKQTMF